MDATKFDSITRYFGRRVSRRAVLQAAALGGAAVAAPSAFRRASAQTSAASALVQRLYENIDAYQYGQAYDLLGSKWHSQQSLANFTKGSIELASVVYFVGIAGFFLLLTYLLLESRKWR